jgi:hypothetical protein
MGTMSDVIVSPRRMAFPVARDELCEAGASPALACELTIDAGVPVELIVANETSAPAAYRFATRRDGGEWFELAPVGVEGREPHRMVFLPPFGTRLEVAYQLETLACGGDYWRFRLTVRQQLFPGEFGWTDLACWTEVGVVSEEAVDAVGGESDVSRIAMVRA